MKTFQLDFVLLGGDDRQKYLRELLIAQGYRARRIGCSDENEYIGSYQELIQESACVVGAIPLLKNGLVCRSPQKKASLTLSGLQEALRPEQKFAAGCIPAEMKRFCKENKVAYFDFMDDLPLTLYNTVATAEGAIAEAIMRSPLNLCHGKSLILGFGRCAQTLANRLVGMKNHVTVAARREDARMLSETLGFDSVPFELLHSIVDQYDLIFNTVPALVLDKNLLQNISRQTVIIDMASAPGGVDYSFAKQNEIPAFLCLGLPGKYSPKSSAEKIAERLRMFYEN